MGLLGAAALSVAASRALVRDAAQPTKLRGVIKLTIAAANVNGLLLAVGLVLATPFPARD